MTPLTKLFTSHPASVDETYFEHMRFAGWFAGTLLLAAGAAIVHAVLPFLFEKTAAASSPACTSARITAGPSRTAFLPNSYPRAATIAIAVLSSCTAVWAMDRNTRIS